MHTIHNNDKIGLGYENKRILYPHSKYVSIPGTRLYTYCENNGHFKDSCMANVKKTQKNMEYVEKRKNLKPEPSSSEKNTRLLGWTKKYSIYPLSHKWGLKLAWVPKTHDLLYEGQDERMQEQLDYEKKILSH